ncbi:gliding motility lipoprotein GldB [uncultured Lutibacter sp.]|uniref:gliding motility lipoprotein GldB n=1 Tax=uncultured Lutibacter sp. TaxID=437739 RepID=UPI0026118976|nr:gliding motility lipoprotein GldB [uncultured Lutibacter sp.]
MNKYLGVAIILLILFSCKREVKPKLDVSNINVDVKVERFEKKFFSSSNNTLSSLKDEFPFLFPAYTPDSIWLAKINNKDERALFNKSQEVFGDFQLEKTLLADLFKHIKYYHANFKEPKIITLITSVDYKSKVVYADSLLFIGLDLYLGEESEFYYDFPKYISRNFNRTQLIVDVSKEIGLKYFNPTIKRQFIDVLIDEGKKMYLLDCYLPDVSNFNKIGYLKDQLQWAENNESEIWKFFIENELLYSSDSKLNARFIDEAPFSKFFIDIDKESPGRIGVWLGWQIVKSYMKNNNVTLQQLLETEAIEIFKKSKYKPKK